MSGVAFVFAHTFAYPYAAFHTTSSPRTSATESEGRRSSSMRRAISA